jgi:hypothetical protein
VLSQQIALSVTPEDVVRPHPDMAFLRPLNLQYYIMVMILFLSIFRQLHRRRSEDVDEFGRSNETYAAKCIGRRRGEGMSIAETWADCMPKSRNLSGSIRILLCKALDRQMFGISFLSQRKRYDPMRSLCSNLNI